MKSLIFIAIIAILLSGCVTNQCPSQRVWMLDPYLYEIGRIAPLTFDAGDLDNPDNFYTDEEFAEFMGVSIEELTGVMKGKNQKTDPDGLTDDTKGTI